LNMKIVFRLLSANKLSVLPVFYKIANDTKHHERTETRVLKDPGSPDSYG